MARRRKRLTWLKEDRLKKIHLHRDVIGILGLFTILRRLFSLVRTPVFWAFTLFGNLCIVGGALLLRRFESPTNPAANEFLECLIWAVGIVTTVGGGSLHPVTLEGKILMIFMMIGGAVFLWSYMAMFIGALVDPELRAIEREVGSLQVEAEGGDRTLTDIRRSLVELEEKLARLSKK